MELSNIFTKIRRCLKITRFYLRMTIQHTSILSFTAWPAPHPPRSSAPARCGAPLQWGRRRTRGAAPWCCLRNDVLYKYDYIWCDYMIIYKYEYIYMIIFDYMWFYMMICDYIWIYMIICDYICCTGGKLWCWKPNRWRVKGSRIPQLINQQKFLNTAHVISWLSVKPWKPWKLCWVWSLTKSLRATMLGFGRAHDSKNYGI